jgi:hypothetical protein
MADGRFVGFSANESEWQFGLFHLGDGGEPGFQSISRRILASFSKSN